MTDQERIKELEREIASLKNKAAGHIDQLLLYATGYPHDTSPNQAVEFYHSISNRPLRTEGQFSRRPG